MQWEWFYLYAAITAACLIIVLEAYRREPVMLTDLRTAGAILLGTFVVSNLSVVLLAHHARFFPLMDSLAAAFFALMWRSNRKWWTLVLFFLFLVECAQHVSFAQVNDHSFRARYVYDLTLNLIYLLQLCTVTTPAFVAIIQRQRRGLRHERSG